LTIILGALLPSGAGCACCRTGQGWVVQSGWSLEFKRLVGCCSGAPDCNVGCAAPIPKEPVCTAKCNQEGEVLTEANPKQLEKLDNSPFAQQMERRGRLGLCGNCGRLARFKESCAGEKPPEPVIARFVPVPTAPDFCNRDEAMQPVPYEQAPKLKEQKSVASVKKSPPKAPLPSEIPPEPVPSKVDRSGSTATKQVSATQEQTSWIFAPLPEKKSEQLIEAQLPPRPSERATR
jgi:hypothetical protein